ncbi:MAG: SdrD B-like domain-containing protein [Candidatus Promineifilaceae bacterium]
MTRRVAFILIIAGLLLVIGVRIFALVSIPASQAGVNPASESLASQTAQTNSQKVLGTSRVMGASLGGIVWSDANMDGLHNGGEFGVSGVLVNIYARGEQGSTTFINSTRTDSSGGYLFASLEPEKSYFVRLIRPKSHPIITLPNQQNDHIDSDFDPISGQSDLIYLSGGEQNTSVSVGLVSTLACLPTINFQFDANGRLLAPGPLPLDGWSRWGVQFSTISAQPQIFNHGNELKNGADFGGSGLHVPSTLSIHFDTARPLYSLRVLDRDDQAVSGTVWAFNLAGERVGEADILPYPEASAQLAILNAVNVSRVEVAFEQAGGITELIFCEPNPASPTALGGLVWRDANADGLHNGGESGFAGATVTLSDNRHPDAPLAQTQTDSLGRYRFDSLLPGTYQVSVQPPIDSTPSHDIDGTPDGVTSALLLEGGAEIEGVNFGFRPNQNTPTDYSDAPGSYQSASHPIDTQLHLGFSVDGDSAAQPSLSAETDDNDGNNDDDGVLFYNPANDIQQVKITLLNQVTARPAYLSGWIDFNQDGDFDDADEQITVDRVVASSAERQQITLDYQTPNNARAGATFARFRLSTTPKLTFAGAAADGEVEDYQITLNGDYSDAPDSYGAPSHTLSDSLMLGVLNGSEDGSSHRITSQPDASDDGIQFSKGARFYAGETIIMRVSALVDDPYTKAHLTGWLDINGDGQFDNATEQLIARSIDPNSASQTILASYTLPINTLCGSTFARFRISERATNPTEPASVGEVEDYPVEIICESTALVGGVIWYDANRNAQQDLSEIGLANVSLRLYRDTGNKQFDRLLDVPVASAQTNADGRYLFSTVDSANYFVVIEDQLAQLSTYQLVTPSQLVTPVSGSELTRINFGLLQAERRAIVGGRVWIDDKDGVSSSAEFGIANATIVARNIAGTTLATTQTDTLGRYQLVLPTDIELTIAVMSDSLPDTLQAINQFASPLRLSPQSATFDHNFAYANRLSATISGKTWLDDNNRRVDAGEQMLPAVSIELIADENGNNRRDVQESIIATARTNSAGRFKFTGLAAGNYLVHVSDVANVLSNHTLLAGLADRQLQDGSITRYAVSLSAGEVFDSADFNYTLNSPESDSGVIGDLVWYETDYNGVNDLGETGIANVRIVLLNREGDFLKETVSDSTGHYLFTGLDTGIYQVVVSDTLGVLDLYMPTLLRSVQRDAVTVQLENGGIMMGADFGYTIGQLSLGDHIWQDTNRDGWQNENGETGLPNILVQLYVDRNYNRQLDKDDLLIRETLSDEQGNYRFDSLRPSSYFVVIPQSSLALPILSSGPTLPFSGENKATAREDMPLDSNGIPDARFGITSNIIDLIGDEIANNGRFNNTIDFGFLPPVEGQ